MRTDLGVVVGAFPEAPLGVEHPAQLDGLVGSGGVDAEGGLAVQPVVCAAQTQPFRADDADVVRRERLAQRARVELIHRQIGQVRETLVAEVVGGSCLTEESLESFRIRVDRHLHLVDDGAEVGVEAGVQDLAEVLQVESGVGRFGRQPDPCDVPLTDVLYSGCTVHEVVDLSLENRLEVLLHLAASDVYDDPQVHAPLRLHVREVGTDHFDLAVRHLVEPGHAQVLEGPRVLATELDPHVHLADDLAFEGGSVGHRYRYVGDVYLHSAYLDALLDETLRPLEVVDSLDLVERHAHDVLVGRHAGWEDLRDHGVGYDREPEVDGARRGGVLQVIHLAQSKDEGEDPPLVVEQDLSSLPALQATEC